MASKVAHKRKVHLAGNNVVNISITVDHMHDKKFIELVLCLDYSKK